MNKYGKMVTCDRCKKTVFSEKVGESVFDGGHTRCAKYEQMQGWKTEYVGNRNKASDLCPDCSELFDIIKKKQKAEWDNFMEVDEHAAD